jgi:glycosyltransferase involved in cell wall biosynthesis
MPIVSVLMSFHGAAKFLSDSVRSVLGQTMSDVELLLIDDRADAEAKKRQDNSLKSTPESEFCRREIPVFLSRSILE